MTRGNNKYGAAGRGGVPAATVVAFLDHYTYEAADNYGVGRGGLPTPIGQRRKHINGKPIRSGEQRQIRRWRNGDTQHVSAHGLGTVLAKFGFDLPWFHAWTNDKGLPLS